MVRTIAGLLVIALLFSVVVTLHGSMRTLSLTYPDEYRSFLIPSSGYARVMSLGYRNAAADILYIWSIQFYDWYNRSVRWAYLDRTYEVITDLDPKFQDAYILGALFAFLGQRWDLVYKIEDKGIANNPDNYIIPYDAGNYAFFLQKDYEKAVKYFKIAWDRNPDRTIITNLLASSYKKQGDLDASLAYWKSIYEKYKDQETDEANYYMGAVARHLWDLAIEFDKREVAKAGANYLVRYGVHARSLRDLVAGGYLTALPRDPAGNPYAYDPATGEITCTSLFDFKAALGQW